MDSNTQPQISWHDMEEKGFSLEGLNWHQPGGILRRIPEKSFVSDRVNSLADNTAGVMLRFRSDTSVVKIQVKLKPWDETYLWLMPQSGSAGFDLYIGSGLTKSFAGSTRCTFGSKEYEMEIFKTEGSGVMREYTLNFPLYSGVDTLKIGLSENAVIQEPAPWKDPRPVVVYGTSIQQGGCASRPGMGHTNQMSRMLDRPFLNLGFSGAGKGEPEMAELLAEIPDPAMYVLDYDANVGTTSLKETLPVFIDILRKKHPETPILLVSRLPMKQEFLTPTAYVPYRQELTEVHLKELSRRREAGDRNIHFLDGSTLYGTDPSECTVDGTHANDLGMYFIARNMAPVIERILTWR